MRRIAYRAAIAATALSLGVFVAGASADLSDAPRLEPFVPGFQATGCEDGYGCAWDHEEFIAFPYKWKIPNNPGTYRLQYGPAHSAKNRFADRRLQLIEGDGTPDGHVIACLDPDESRPDPGRFGYVHVGLLGSDCNH